MAETLFPERQRCKKCRKGLGEQGAAVFLGLFCTARCASMAEPATDPAKAPRECKTARDGGWVFKRRYRSESEIPNKLRNDPSVDHYWCTNSCGNLHIGHSRIDLKREQFRMLGDRGALADFLVKSRGEASHKQVATVAGIRPIRLKELEDAGFPSPDMNALFAVLPLYQARLGVSLKA